jgi:hypothetical protein
VLETLARFRLPLVMNKARDWATLAPALSENRPRPRIDRCSHTRVDFQQTGLDAKKYQKLGSLLMMLWKEAS